MQSNSFRIALIVIPAAACAFLLVAFSCAQAAWPTPEQRLASAAELQIIKQLRIVHVDDGDTVIGLTASNDQKKVRLASIDAPEASHTNQEKGKVGQPYSMNSKRHLEALVMGKTVDVNCVDLDKYGRFICELSMGGKSVNAAMVRNGWAWANTASNGRYLRDRLLPQLQADAQRTRAGLWAGLSPVPPWEWRKQCWEQGNCPN